MRSRGPQTKQRTPLQKGRPQTPSIIQWAGLDRPVTLGLIVLLACVVSAGLSVVLTTHQNRFAFNELQELKDQANQFETEWGQLLLEQSTFGVDGRIEQQAIEQLQMQLPELSEIVMVSHD
jgi:cell division protein FtsL